VWFRDDIAIKKIRDGIAFKNNSSDYGDMAQNCRDIAFKKILAITVIRFQNSTC
jgi:hypothetical protein